VAIYPLRSSIRGGNRGICFFTLLSIHCTWELLTMSPESGLNLKGGRFPKGQSGNPKGKPKRAGNRKTMISQNVAETAVPKSLEFC
jgi:hypothetical protein